MIRKTVVETLKQELAERLDVPIGAILTRDEIAEWLGVKRTTLSVNMESHPPFFKKPGHSTTLYPLAWAKEHQANGKVRDNGKLIEACQPWPSAPVRDLTGKPDETTVDVLPHSDVYLDEAHDAIQNWRQAKLATALRDAANGRLSSPTFGSNEHRRITKRCNALLASDWEAVTNEDGQSFDWVLAEALTSQGVQCAPQHPVIPHLRKTFGRAWLSVENEIMKYRYGYLPNT